MSKSGLKKAGYDYLVIDGRRLVFRLKVTFLFLLFPVLWGKQQKSGALQMDGQSWIEAKMARLFLANQDFHQAYSM